MGIWRYRRRDENQLSNIGEKEKDKIETLRERKRESDYENWQKLSKKTFF